LKNGINKFENSGLRTIIWMILFFIFHSNLSQTVATAGSYTVEYKNGNKTSIDEISLNGKAYFSLKKAADIFFPGKKYNEQSNEIKWNGNTLRFNPVSFFVVIDKDSKENVYQMSLPTLIYKGELIIPITPFFEILSKYGLIFAEFNGKLVKISENLTETKKEDKALKNQKIIKPKKSTYTNDIIKVQDTVNIKPEISEEPIKVSPKHEPDKYIIPKDLIIRHPKVEEKEIEVDTVDVNQDIENYGTEGELYASLILMPETKKNYINKIVLEEKDSYTYITFIAPDTVMKWQKPEMDWGTLIIRFPDLTNKVKFDTLKYPVGIKSISSKVINNILVYDITLTARDISGTSIKKTAYNKATIRLQLKNIPEENLSREEILRQTFIDSTEIAAPPKETDLKAPANPKEARKWDLDVVILDPGHGGQDPGAISIFGYLEKTLALEIAKEVRGELKKTMPDLKVLLTREDDRFIELQNRTKYANKSHGKLFVSIHLNSMPEKPYPSNGFETYILRAGRTDDAIRVADKENSVIDLEKSKEDYKKLTEEELIIATMAQSSFVKFSELFAGILQNEVAATTPMKSRGVNQAGFYVLVGASMPNVLFEAGFLSNEQDEKFITGKNGTGSIAKGIANAIVKYSKEYKKLMP
jgi:N-acetylmuramoyl-L-alanine amidase